MTRDKVFQLRISEDELAEIRAAAERAGMNPSGYVREAALGGDYVPHLVGAEDWEDATEPTTPENDGTPTEEPAGTPSREAPDAFDRRVTQLKAQGLTTPVARKQAAQEV